MAKNQRSYTKEEKEQICEEVLLGMSEGGLSYYKSCVKAGVPIATFMSWLEKDDKLVERYARARQNLIERIAEETMAIADEKVPMNNRGSFDNAAVQKQRLQVDTRKWLLSKLAPKKYGDRLSIAGDDSSPLKVDNSLDVSKLSTEVLQEIIAAKNDLAKK